MNSSDQPPPTDPVEALVVDAHDSSETTVHQREAVELTRGLVPTTEAARIMGVSEATLLRRARELGGKRGPRGKWMFELERLSVVREDTRRSSVSPRFQPLSRPSPRGALAARLYPLLRAAVPLDEACERLEADPLEVKVLFEQWIQLRQMTTAWLSPSQADAPPPAPKFNHEPSEDGSCCPAHRIQKETKAK